MFIAMDANFGLVRKKSAGASTGSCNHEGRMFIDSVGGETVSRTNTEDVNKSIVSSANQKLILR